MLARTLSLSLATLLCVPGLLAAQDRSARSRSSSTQSRSSGSDDRHRSPEAGAASRHARPRSASPRDRGASSSFEATRTRPAQPATPPLTGAQARHPRPGTGTGTPGYRPGRYGSSYYYPGYRSYYRPYYYGLSARHFPSWYGLGLGLGAYYSYYPSYSYYPYYPYYGGVGYGYSYAPLAPTVYVSRRDEESGAVRVQVQPSRTLVYVDGHLAGKVDDFDGLLQRLYVSPGRHELTFELDGYRTHRVLIYVSPGTTLKLRHDMEEGIGAATLDDLTGGRGENDPPPPAERDRAYARGGPGSAAPPTRAAGAGVLTLHVSPADASVYVDGSFRGAGATALELSLSPGAHRVEVVRPGYDPWVREIQVEEGESRELSVELPPR